ncbi:MAG: hypothetical protein BJ554DRAFT_2904 [Olpidium bornovanus]|uniref:BTB domain-containing protein n=1 Tax=Olpidium bornovanus TaxID=278681 RepID=A0A8H7ZPR9_9FUNG|nr:MAG: hypothetical protein BJ554DRAFT_2904 [Olpidium bornovanus]
MDGFVADGEHSTTGTPPPALTRAQRDRHHGAVCDHLYHTGFLNGLFSDVTVNVPNLVGGGKAYNLHSLILARSPYLYRLLLESPTQSEITLAFDNDQITEDGLAISIGHLYAGYSQHLVHPANATAVLAAAYLLELKDLAAIATERIMADVGRETVLRYVKFLGECNGTPSSSSSSSSSSASSATPGLVPSGRFGEYSAQIQACCFEYLTKWLPLELPEEMQLLEAAAGLSSSSSPGARPESNHGQQQKAPASGTGPAARRGQSFKALPLAGSLSSAAAAVPFPEDVIDMFVDLPFPWLKAAIQSPSFLGPDGDMRRYQFAQTVISRREKVRRRRIAEGEIESGGEESVVLSFGSGEGAGGLGKAGKSGASAVTVVRKPLKSGRNAGKPERVLWKAPV